MIHETERERNERLKKTFQRRGSMSRSYLSKQYDESQTVSKIRIRMHVGCQGSIRRSMQTITEIHATKASVIEYLHTHAILNLDTSALKIQPYFMEPDGRVGWKQTYSVTDGSYGILAFTNGPII